MSHVRPTTASCRLTTLSTLPSTGSTSSGSTLVAASCKHDVPPTKYKLKVVTCGSQRDILERSSIDGLVPVSKLPALGMPLDEVALATLELVSLGGGGTYVRAHLVAPLE